MTATGGDTGRPMPLALMRERGCRATDARLRLPGTMDASSPGARERLLVEDIGESRPRANTPQATV